MVLALENTLSAADNRALLAAVASPAVPVYFDVSNAMWWGHDSPAAIRRLGRAIAQIHFKDGQGGHSNAMLGQGHVDFPGVARSTIVRAPRPLGGTKSPWGGDGSW